MSAAVNEAIALQALDLRWSAGGRAIVDGVSLQLRDGEMLGLIGPNGSGKSSLLRLLAGLARPDTGQVLLGGQPLHRMARRQVARRLALVAQLADTDDALSAQDAVELGRTPWRSALQPWSPQDDAIVDQALAAVGMGHRRTSAWRTLSGGERQRVHIARALAQQPRVLLLDEPTNHLDIHQQLSLLQLIADLPVAKLLAIHDLNQALRCDRLAVLHQGRLVLAGTPAQVLQPGLLQGIFQVRVREWTDPADGARVLRLLPLDDAPGPGAF